MRSGQLICPFRFSSFKFNIMLGQILFNNKPRIINLKSGQAQSSR
jgi:hypothetical protein